MLSLFAGRSQHRRQRKPETVPSVFPWTSSPSVVSSRSERLNARQNRKRDPSLLEFDDNVPPTVCEEIVYEEIIDTINAEKNNIEHVEEPIVYPASTQTSKLPLLSVDTIMRDDFAFSKFTGLAFYEDF